MTRIKAFVFTVLALNVGVWAANMDDMTPCDEDGKQPDGKPCKCAEKYGEKYVMHAIKAAGGGRIALDVEYEDSVCEGGGSSFETSWMDKDGTTVVFAKRAAPSCADPLPEARKWRGWVEVPIPGDLPEGQAFMAFPFGSPFDLHMLPESDATAPAGGGFMASAA